MILISKLPRRADECNMDNAGTYLEHKAFVKGWNMCLDRVQTNEISQPTTSDIVELLRLKDIKELSNGSKTFDELESQIVSLFKLIVRVYPKVVWKTRKGHDNLPCEHGEKFILGFDAPSGIYINQFDIKYWDSFKCDEIEYSKYCDYFADKDIERLLSLHPEEDN